MRVNEIFYSIQGEGAHSGEAAIFVRLSGCNLKCPFCDTEHRHYDELSEEEICEEVAKYPAELVVITGGEPTLQLTASLVERIRGIGKIVAIETNGTHRIPDGVDWVTVSPKEAYVGNPGRPVIREAQEVKIVLDGEASYADPSFGIKADYYFVQPCDTGDARRNEEILEHCVNFVKKNPKWKMSIQTQKILKVR